MERLGGQLEIDVRSVRTMRICRKTLPTTPTVIVPDGV
jgi:hypothetical protein